MFNYFKSIIDNDKNAVVICDQNHRIIYMNPAAVRRYEKRGGAALIGENLLSCHNARSINLIEKTLMWFRENRENNIVYTFYNEKENKDVYMVALRDESGNLIGYYEKHEIRNRETQQPYNFLK